jgi:hypothetical protein
MNAVGAWEAQHNIETQTWIAVETSCVLHQLSDAPCKQLRESTMNNQRAQAGQQDSLRMGGVEIDESGLQVRKFELCI